MEEEKKLAISSNYLTIIIEKDYVKKCFQLKLTYLISLAILKKKF